MVINHGANLFNISRTTGINQSDLLDFSSNINPFGSSLKAKKAIIENIDRVSIYPDPEYINLKSSISYYSKCNKNNIILGAGATELISSFINVTKPKNALLLCPCYSEYEKELSKINCNITKLLAKEINNFKIDVEDVIKLYKNNYYDLIIICNPNNPTGFAFTENEIKNILENCNCNIMIDETYIEFTNKDIFSSSKLVDKFLNLFVIRGTSKFFSTPGIRLGYALTSNRLLFDNMYKHIDLWNINIFASIMGEIMFKDDEYISNTINHIKTERDLLNKELNSIKDIKVYESNGNFILCNITSKKITAKALYDELIKNKIVIRDCSSFEGLDEYYFRVCILKPYENKFLIQNLLEIFRN